MEEKYKVGFYILLGIIIGFIIGTYYESKHNETPIEFEDNDAVQTNCTNNNEDNDELNYKNIIEELNRLDIKHPEIVFAQILLETNWLKSNVCKNKNNLLGLMHANKYHEFDKWQDSLVFYKYRIQNRYNESKNENYYNFLKRIGYAEDENYTQKLKTLVKQGYYNKF